MEGGNILAKKKRGQRTAKKLILSRGKKKVLSGGGIKEERDIPRNGKSAA